MNSNTKQYRYQRVLLKISGESFGGNQIFCLDTSHTIIQQIKILHQQHIQIGLVIGGGNIIRGEIIAKSGIDRAIGDSMGMLATTINALLLGELFRKADIPARVLTTRAFEGIGELYQYPQCMKYLTNGEVLIFAGGTGHPFFTTDTGAALRAVEISADCLLKATKVDGVYDDDPLKNPQAKKFDFLTYNQVLTGRYHVMDFTAISFCMENHLPIQVFDLAVPDNLLKIVQGYHIGTLVADKQP